MKQNSINNGTYSSVKVNAVMSNGIVIEVMGNSFFLPYNSNPWFEKATIADVFNVEMVGKTGIRWDRLDVDLAIDSLQNPEKYPLIAKYA